MVLRHKRFQATLRSWNVPFDEAAAFATELGPERVISVSHSCDHQQGPVVVVWYWAEEGLAVPED